MNSGNPLGLGEFNFWYTGFNSHQAIISGWLQTTIEGGRRSSSATSYLGPEFIRRHNLHVLVNARVTRIRPTSSGNHSLAFNTVEFSQGVNSISIFFSLCPTTYVHTE